MVVVLPGDLIIQRGDVSSPEIFIICVGSVQVHCIRVPAFMTVHWWGIG